MAMSPSTRRFSRSALPALLVVAGLLPGPASAAAEGAMLDKLQISGSHRTRLEMWDFFEPSGAGGANNNYNFVGNTLRLKAAWIDDRFDVVVEGQGVALGALPSNAVGNAAEGPLGLGAVYRGNNSNDDSDVSAYLRQANLKLKNLGIAGLTMSGGRQLFSDGKEAMATDPTLAWLQKLRIGERLIGPFDFTYAGRSFDSALVAYEDGPLNVTGFYGKPSQGGFNVVGMDEINHIDVVYGAVNLNQAEWAANTSARLFYIYYADDRSLLKVDNRPLAVRQADTGDISIHTIGANVLQAVPTGVGTIDLLGWFAYQTGDWGVQDQDSWAFAFEAGIQPSDLPWKPWFRIGYDMGSGDDDAGDGDHESFFQILPTARVYSLSTFYNLMNSQDLFAQVILKPMEGLVWRTDVHVLDLSEDDDLWYFGGGATREKRNIGFGYGGRPSGGRSSLMEVLETQVSYTWNQYVATTLYYGHAFGEGVVEADFSNKDANYGFLEVTLSLPPL